MVCGGCGTVIEASEPYPFRCPRAGDGGDHVLRRVLDVDRLEFSLEANEPNPFVRWRGLLHAYHLATAYGMSDQAYVELVRDLDDEVARVDGHGFVVTPFLASLRRWPGAFRPGPRSGSRTRRATSRARTRPGTCSASSSISRWSVASASTEGTPPPLAIASCGNAALAAAVVAAAGRQRLLVFVPTDAEPAVRRPAAGARSRDHRLPA